MGILYHFAEAKPGLPDNLTTLPGYHFVVLTLTHGHPTDWSARGTTMLFSLLGLIAFAGAWREYHRERAGIVTLLFALLPILQPFTGMAYSDAPGLAILLWAWWAQIRGQRFAAAVLLALSCCIRQTNIVWGAFFVAWQIWHDWQNAPPAGCRDALARTMRSLARSGWVLTVIVACAIIILAAGRFTPGTENGNPLRPNRAALDFAALLYIGLGWPALLCRARKTLAAVAGYVRTHPWRGTLAAALGAGMVVILARTFANPHPWNQDLYFSDTHFTLLRNWPLVYLQSHPPARFASAGFILFVAAVMVWGWRQQRFRHDLWLTLPFSAALLASNFLVDPRYYITPAVFILFFYQFSRRQIAGLLVWFALVCAVHAPFIVAGKSLW